MPRQGFPCRDSAIANLAIPAPAPAQTLTLAVAAAPTSVDPHYHTFGPNASLDIHLFDYLVDVIRRCTLSRHWRCRGSCWWTTPPGNSSCGPAVKFQDSAPTSPPPTLRLHVSPGCRRVPSRRGSFSIYTKPGRQQGRRPIPDTSGLAHGRRLSAAADRPDPGVHRFHTASGRSRRPGDFNSGQERHRQRRHISVTSCAIGERVELDRNDAWWGPEAMYGSTSPSA